MKKCPRSYFYFLPRQGSLWCLSYRSPSLSRYLISPARYRYLVFLRSQGLAWDALGVFYSVTYVT